MSGDYYDLLQVAAGRMWLAVGDVTGKGAPMALVMATTRSPLREGDVAGDGAGHGVGAPERAAVRSGDVCRRRTMSRCCRCSGNRHSHLTAYHVHSRLQAEDLIHLRRKHRLNRLALDKRRLERRVLRRGHTQ